MSSKRGTYQSWAAFCIGNSLRISKNVELLILHVEPHRVIIKKLLECMPELHNNSNRKYSQISIHEKRELCQNLRKLWLFMFALCFGVCINKSMWYNFPTYGKSLNSKATQLRKDNKQPRNFTGGVLNELHIYHSSCGSHKAVKLM